MTRQSLAYIYALLAVLLWSTAATAFKLSLQHLDVLQLLFWSSLVSLCVLLVIIVLQKKTAQLRPANRNQWLLSAVLGFLNPFFYYVVLFRAYDLLPAQQAQPLNYTWPIMLVLLSIPLLKQSISLKTLLAILISFLGVCIISTQGDLLGLQFTNLEGALLATGSAVIWALFWLYNVKDERDAVIKLFLNFVFGFIYIAIATAIFSDISLPSIEGFVGAAYVGFFEMGITFVFWLTAMKLTETTARISKLIFLSPFLSLLFIYFILGEKILLATVVGLIFIIAGIVLEQIRFRKKSV